MPAHDKRPARTVLVFHGAVGDFFNAWPAIRALRLGLTGPVFWAGRSDVLPWLRPLGLESCPAGLAQDLLRLEGSGRRPPGLADCLVVRFSLRPGPEPEGQWRLAALPPPLSRHEYEPPREVWLRELARHGLGPDPGWLQAFRACFGRGDPKASRLALLFPGAGHRAKRWPLVQYLELAAALHGRDLEPALVLGPAETEAGLDPGPWPGLRPADLASLAHCLARARLVVGNDCGPMHLAGMMGLPGVVLFGPTSARQWTPPGLAALRGSAPCRPCTRTTADLDCPCPVCLETLPLEAVKTAVEAILDQAP